MINKGLSDSEKKIRLAKSAYLFEAAFEYLISILVSGAFLAALLKNIGFSDALTGTVTTVATLSISVQFFAVILIHPRGKGKRYVTIMSLVNQLLFASFYMIPSVRISHGLKIIIFLIIFVAAHFISNAAVPFRLSWLMSYVDENERGVFTANKEILSLISGIVFSWCMGMLADYYNSAGKEKTGFIIMGITIIILSVFHLISLLFVVGGDDSEKKIPPEKTPGVTAVLKNCFNSNPQFKKIVFLDVLWQSANGISVAFFGIYQINELGFTMKYAMLMAAVSAISRILFSRFFGKFSDKYSREKMLSLSFLIGGAGFLVNSFTSPANGKILFAIYSICSGIHMAGANGGLMNIVFDHVKEEDCAGALGIKSSIGGLCGFGASLIGAWILSNIQRGGNTVFGMKIYAQQILSFIAFIILISGVFYINNVILKIKKND